jgi:4-diphosphocytidyl-2-C-methyl-D-erythritol kinase
MPTAVRSHAKINLGLYIGAPRPDGFHSLVTVYQTLELHDVVTVTARPAKATALRLTSNDSRVPADGRNTAWRMVELALEALGLSAEVEIHIEKRLPVQGGLGAGSANAVAALVGLEAELDAELGAGNGLRGLPPFEQKTLEGWGTRLEAELGIGNELPGFPGLKSETWGTQNWSSLRMEIAAQVGSDVPLFLIGGTVLGLDRGQQVYPLPDLEPVWCVVATPEIGVSTPQAFRDWDALCADEGLTAEASAVKLEKLSCAYASAFAGAIPEGGQGDGSSGVLSIGENLAGPQESALVRTGISSWFENDFERVVFPQHPSLAEIKRILLGSGTPEAALHASLSGSGSALYGLYRTRGDAEAARERLRPAGVASQLTRTLPRREYWREMLLQEPG